MNHVSPADGRNLHVVMDAPVPARGPSLHAVMDAPVPARGPSLHITRVAPDPVRDPSHRAMMVAPLLADGLNLHAGTGVPVQRVVTDRSESEFPSFV